MLQRPYLVQTIHFFRGVNDSITSATRRIHVGGMLFGLVCREKPLNVLVVAE